MRLIGITGGIGAGKSVVSRILRLRGETVYDCDYEARRLMENSPEIRLGVKVGLGDDCIKADGSLDRRRIAKIVFADKEKLDLLNHLVHSAVREDISGVVKRAKLRGGKRLFIESAILASSGLAGLCSEILLVEADDKLRFRRAMARGGIDAADLQSRMQAQLNEFSGLSAEKVRIIANDGSTSLLSTLDSFLESIDIKK